MVELFSNRGRLRRRTRNRRRLGDDKQTPRLAVFRSNRHIYAQVIEDQKSLTLASASSLEKQFAEQSKSAAAESVGAAVAERARKARVQAVVFDRGGFMYHGRVKKLAEAARKQGLQF